MALTGPDSEDLAAEARAHFREAFDTFDGELVELTVNDPRRAWNDVSPKVTAGALGAAVATIVTWAAEAGLGIDIPVSVETAAALVVAFVVGYLVPDTR